jgi:hypothetical protein
MVEPAETLPAWLPLCVRCEGLAGTGLGRQQRMYARWGRRDAEIDQEVVEYVPGVRLRWRHVAERIGGRAAPAFSTSVTTGIELHPAGGGTRVVLTSRSTPSGPLAALLLRWTVAPRIRRAFDLALDRLAASGG